MDTETTQTAKFSLDQFTELLGQKPEFIATAMAQLKKDASILNQLGVEKKAIMEALGYAVTRKPRTVKPLSERTHPAIKKAGK